MDNPAALLLFHVGAGFSPHVRPEGRTHMGEVGFDSSHGHTTRWINLIPVQVIWHVQVQWNQKGILCSPANLDSIDLLPALWA